MKHINSLNDIHGEVGVISLPTRKQYICDTLSNMNINITILFDAILGSSLNLKELKKQGIVSENCNLKINEIACALSHLALIKKFYTESIFNSMMIFEDDIVYNGDYFDKIKNLDIPKDYDIIQYGHCWDNCFSMKKINDSVYKSSNPLCCHSYCISKKGARKVLEKAFPIEKPIDIFIVELSNAEKLNIYTVYPRIFNQGKSMTEKNILLDTTLGNNDDCSECKEDFIISFIYNNLRLIIFIIIIIIIIVSTYFIQRKMK